jgi:hypothetical protein
MAAMPESAPAAPKSMAPTLVQAVAALSDPLGSSHFISHFDISNLQTDISIYRKRKTPFFGDGTD